MYAFPDIAVYPNINCCTFSSEIPGLVCVVLVFMPTLLLHQSSSSRVPGRNLPCIIISTVFASTHIFEHHGQNPFRDNHLTGNQNKNNNNDSNHAVITTSTMMRRSRLLRRPQCFQLLRLL